MSLSASQIITNMDSATVSNTGDDQEPLISTPQAHFVDGLGKKKSLVLWVLEISTVMVSVSWVVVVLMYPTEWFNSIYQNWVMGAGNDDGMGERVFLLLSSQFLIVAFLIMARQIVLDSQGEEQTLQLRRLGSAKPGYRLRTFPVMVDGMLGVVSAAEAIGIIVVIVYLIWALIVYTIDGIQELAQAENKMYILFYKYGNGLGDVGSFSLSLMFLPVARGSPFLRLVNVSFEHTTKYHIWLGNLTMVIYTLHGLSMTIAYTAKGDFKAIISWSNDGVVILAGVITLLIGWSIWITSIHRIRHKYFEMFFYTHRLYVLFVIFLVMHVGDFFFASSLSGAIFIYIIDRFLRFYQSRKVVDVVSMKYHTCGVVELALAKHPNLQHGALSSIFVRIKEVSKLQWHPFSVSSTPLDGKDHLSVMMKVQGEWTRKLEGKVLSMLESNNGESHQLKLTTFVEGPYGHQLPYYLRYKDLVLVAGGIGITPFLAITSDILHRVKEGKPCPTRNILLVWAIKKSDELQLISQITSCFSNEHVNVETRVFVTREPAPPPTPNYENGSQYISSTASQRVISSMAGTGNSKWLAIYFLSSVIGLIIFRALVDIFRVNFLLGPSVYWYRGIVLLACMLAAVAFSGGLVLRLWCFREGKPADSNPTRTVTSTGADVTVDRVEGGDAIKENVTSIEYGSRPDLHNIFESVNDAKGHVDVGVIVCGPPSLESGAATQCRRLNLRRKGHEPIFHFHSHSYSS